MADKDLQQWHLCRLDDVITLKHGKLLSKELLDESGKYPVYGSNGVIGRTNEILHYQPTIVIGRVGASGQVHLTNGPAWFTDNSIYVSKLSNELCLEFLYYFLRYSNLSQYSSKTSQPLITQTTIKRQHISIPSMTVQCKIVSFLRLSQQIKEKQEQANKLTNKIIQSVFVKMFGTGKYPAYPIRNHTLKTELRDPRKQASKVFKYVDIGGIDSKYGRIVEVKDILGRDAPSRARKVIKRGDVIVSTVRPNLNATAIVPANLDDQICSTGFSVLRCRPSLDPNYLYAFTRRADFIRALSLRMKGASYPAVTNDDVLDLEIPLPPIDLQMRFSGFIVRIEDISKKQEKSSLTINELFNSIMNKAFKEDLLHESIKQPDKNVKGS